MSRSRMLKTLAMAAAGSLLAGAAAAQHEHGGGAQVEKTCKIRKPGEAEAKAVPCEDIEREMGGHGGPGGPGGHGGPAGGRHGMMGMHHAGPDALDVNKDGKLSLEEFSAPMREHFQAMDKNKSGFLEKDEMHHPRMVVEQHIEKKD